MERAADGIGDPRLPRTPGAGPPADQYQWAVDIGLAARLDIGQEGYIAVRGMPAPAPYLASGHFL
ncbi:hypothetical protein GCM10023084_34400 [Streptomyces lacrimifluminis]|uniref:Uncharacterized protein n=1 Tax=Streptomyces lacrimifluminis TaxID=1500077 RepID=A0A917KWL9_9ACTN|nr:hypothetical protein [Streptomyces lacrimifluminis]GGJ30785.1 hypothetical protein GCM10012282_29290 [Streptomyces lacrimifluminis]